MAFCSNCGLKLMDEAKFCPVCGTRTPLAGAVPTPKKPVAPSPNNAESEPVATPSKKREKKSSATAPVVPTAAPRQAAVTMPVQAEESAVPKSRRRTAAPITQKPLQEAAPTAVPEAVPAAVPVVLAKTVSETVPEAAPAAMPVRQVKPANPGTSLHKKKLLSNDEYDEAYIDDEDETDLFEDIDPEPDGNVHDLSVGAKAVLSYGNLLFLVPLLTSKDSRYARFHAVQGFNLFLFEVVGALLVWLISVLIAALLGGGIIGVLLGSILPSLFGLFCCVLSIIGVVHVCQGQMKRLPLIGKLRILK